jgi:hypothetical protein
VLENMPPSREKSTQAKGKNTREKRAGESQNDY